MTAVRRAEESRGRDSVMGNDSQQACGRAQPPGCGLFTW